MTELLKPNRTCWRIGVFLLPFPAHACCHAHCIYCFLSLRYKHCLRARSITSIEKRSYRVNVLCSHYTLNRCINRYVRASAFFFLRLQFFARISLELGVFHSKPEGIIFNVIIVNCPCSSVPGIHGRLVCSRYIFCATEIYT